MRSGDDAGAGNRAHAAMSNIAVARIFIDSFVKVTRVLSTANFSYKLTTVATVAHPKSFLRRWLGFRQGTAPHGGGGGARAFVRSNSIRKRRSVPSRRSAYANMVFAIISTVQMLVRAAGISIAVCSSA